MQQLSSIFMAEADEVSLEGHLKGCLGGLLRLKHGALLLNLRSDQVGWRPEFEGLAAWIFTKEKWRKHLQRQWEVTIFWTIIIIKYG